MTPDEILEIDAKRNHPPGTVAGHLRADINKELRQQGQLVQQGDTLIVFRSIKKGVVEYHCFNADTPENLVKNVVAFLGMLKKIGIKTAVTPYQNPKINDLLRSFAETYKTDITKKGDVITATTHLAGD
jgi:hypothetical protein